MPVFSKREFYTNSIPLLKKSFLENILDGNTSLIDVLKHSKNSILDLLKENIAEKVDKESKETTRFSEGNFDEVSYSFLGDLNGIVNSIYQRMLLEQGASKGYKLTEEDKKRIKEEATEEALKDYSFDLGKVLAYYISMGTMMNHRAKVLPILNVFKHVFTKYQKDELNSSRISDIERMTHQFEVFTGNAQNKKEGVSDKKVLSTEEKEEFEKLIQIPK